MAQILCRDVSLGYDGRIVSEHISFEVHQGDYFCIVGENGSGKSTLMRALLHLKMPLHGEILFGDGLSRRDIGYLPQQNPLQKDFPASVREVVRSGFAGKNGMRPFYTHAQKQIAETTLRQLGIDDLAGRSFSTLSGGQQQRTLLARALCAADKLLLLDEPVAGLDPHATEEMYAVIEQLNQHHITVLMITHDPFAVLRYASKVLHMGAVPTLFESAEAYRNSPYFPKEPERRDS